RDRAGSRVRGALGRRHARGAPRRRRLLHPLRAHVSAPRLAREPAGGARRLPAHRPRAGAALAPGPRAGPRRALRPPFGCVSLPPRPRPAQRVRPVSSAGLVGRMAAGAALMVGVTALAQALGPTWSGLLTVFPVATTVLTVSWHRTQGPEFAVYLLRGLGSGL